MALGRTHNTSDPSFIALGRHKSLSRSHFTIFYRDANGGRLGQYGEDDELLYQPNQKVKQVSDDENSNKESDADDTDNIILPNGFEVDDDGKLPANSFFAVKCLSKNKIFIGGRKVEQGQVALLKNKTTMQIATHSLYFLLPVGTTAAGSHSASTMEIPNPAFEAYQKKRAIMNPSEKEKSHKRQRLDPSTTSSTGGGSTATHHARALSNDLEALPREVLMSRMTEAIENNQWDRKNQMLGSAISLHAVRDAAKSSELGKIALRDGGVCRGDVMKWIVNSPIYSKWVSQMLTKMELKSYQSNIGKALTKRGYIRTGTTGRHVRWTLPDYINPEITSKNHKEDDDSQAASDNENQSSDENEDDDDDDDDDDDEDNDEENEQEENGSQMEKSDDGITRINEASEDDANSVASDNDAENLRVKKESFLSDDSSSLSSSSSSSGIISKDSL